jgi:hypothetical protein
VKRLGLIVLVVSLAPRLATGQEAKLEAPLEATLGDPIPVILEVTTDASTDAAVPDQSFDPFEVLTKSAAVEPSQDGSSRTFTFELTLQCFAVGTHQLGPIQVRLSNAAGELEYLETEARAIEVHSVLANEPNAELKPPTEPVTVEQDDYTLLVVLGALLAVLLGALGAWFFLRWWQRRDRPEPAAPPPPPPWESALAELRSLEESRADAIRQGRTEQWVDAVSDAIRNYFGRRFGFHGLESTTDEIAEALERAESLAIEPREAVAFLGQCDLVKFARASLADEASRDLIAHAFALVHRTRVTEEATAAGSGGAS